MGIFQKLFGRFNRTQRRTQQSRRLRVEALERRQQMAGDLASITGTIFTDLTDNGLTPDDTRINNATVRLFRDGGNNTFDNGGPDDITVGTATSNAAGVYRFDNLIAGTYYLRQDAIPGQVQRANDGFKTIIITENEDGNPATGTATGAQGTILDSYDTAQQVISNALNVPDGDAVPAAEAIGGQRELFVNMTAVANPATDSLQLVVGGGQLVFNTSNGADGVRIITYDGLAEADPAVVDGTGLGGIDLTGGGNAVGFRLLVGNDSAGGSVILRVYSSAVNFSTLTIPLPNTGGPINQSVTAKFADFVTGGGTGANFTNINALQIELDSGSADGGIDIFETVQRSVITANLVNLNPMSLGNTIFRDNDNDGIKDPAEPGIQGVSVELYADTNGNGVYNAGVDTLIGTQTTGAAGDYLFQNLLPGNYIAVIPASQFLAAAPLFSMVTSTNTPNDPDDDVDNDDNGAVVGAVVATGAITLVSGGEPTNDGDGVNGNLTLDLGFTPQVNLAIDKSGTATIDAGGRVTYTLTVTNNSPIAATNVVVTDDLPTGVTFVPNGTNGSTSSAAWVQQANPNAELTTTIASLAANGGSQTLTVVVNTDPALVVGTINNVATVTSDGTELPQNLNDNQDNANTNITRNAVLTLTKVDGRTTVSPGDTFTYTLTVTNTGLSTANNVTLTDTLPAGYTFVSFTNGSQGNPIRTTVAGLDRIDATLASLAVGAQMIVGINVAVAANIAGTTIRNTATADSDDSQPIDAFDDNNIVRNINLTMDKTVNTPTVGVGGQVTYTLKVTNNGALPVTGVEVDDDLPAGFTFVSATSNNVTVSPNANRDLLWTVGNLAVNQEATVQIVAAVGNGVPPGQDIRNTATIAVNRLVGFTDIDPNDNSDFAAVTVEPRFNLGISKDDGQTTVNAGSNTVYTIIVDNTGPNAANNVTITDDLPAGLQYVSSTVGGNAVGGMNAQRFTANVGTIASGASVTLLLTVKVLESATGANITNAASVTADNANTQETGNRPNVDDDVNTLVRTVTLNVNKTGPTTPVLANTDFTYTIVVFNSGTADAPNVLFSDPLPAGVTFKSGSFTINGGGTGQVAPNPANNNRLEANLGTLLANGNATTRQATITLTVTAGANLTGQVANEATISSPDNQAGVKSTANVTVNPNFNIKVSKTDNATTVQAGQNLVYTIVVTNDGPSAATNVLVSDTLPTNQLTFVSATTGFTNNNGVVSGTINTLASGATATVTITATVKNDVPNGTVITNPVNVSAANEPAANTGNNSAQDQTTVSTLTTISGFSYIDLNRDGVKGAGEPGIPNVIMFLTGTANGQAVNKQATTNADGLYTFSDLAPGTYSVSQTQPTGFTDSVESAGSTGGTPVNTAGSDQINNIPLTGTASANNNFAETRVLSKRLFLSSTTANTR